MKGLFWILALFGLAVAVALGAQMNDGYVLFVVPPWRLEISLNLLLLALFLAFIAFYVFLRAVLVTLGLPARVQAYRARRLRERSGQIFQDAVRQLFEGRFGQALKRASGAWEAGIAPELSALIAARAAQRLGEPERQEVWLARAKAADSRNEAAALMLEAEMMVEARRFDDALVALGRLQGKQGRHIAALRLELRARQGIGDSNGILKLVRQLAKRDALPPEAVREIRTKAHLANIAMRRDDERALIDYLRALPADERGERIFLAAAGALTEQGAELEAQKLIESALEREVSEDTRDALVGLYGQLAGADPMSRIARAEGWLLARPQDGGLLLALGRMCLRQRLWGKAQSYLEASLSVDPTQAAHLELARLFDQLERPDEANRHYRASVGPAGDR